MKPADLRTRSADDLRTLAEELKTKLAAIKFEGARKKVKNVKEELALRKDIARVLTLLKEKK